MINRQDRTSLKVSIVTPSYNQGPFIEKTILSVLGQDFPNLEYIVVDGNSGDQTREVLRKYEDRIDVLIIEKDHGQADALNKGFKRATGQVLAYLNSDDCYANHQVISTVVDYFQRCRDVSVVYGRREFINQNGYFVKRFPFRAFSPNDFLICDFIPQECTFWTRSIFDRSGPYVRDELDFALDYELWLRFLKCGAHFLAIPESVGLFRCYYAQKSHAQWRTRGLQEIARVHQKYLGRIVAEAEMEACLDRHFYGVIPFLHQAQKLCHHASDGWEAVKERFWTRFPRDGWVNRQPGISFQQSRGRRRRPIAS